MEDDDLASSIAEYEQQLKQVQNALLVADSETKTDLITLKTDLEQLINLTKENLLSVKKAQLLAELDVVTGNNSSAPTNSEQISEAKPTAGQQKQDDLDEEFMLFKAELCEKDCGHNSESQLSQQVVTEDQSDLSSELLDLEGSKCRAPFSQEWGEHSYHNAVVLAVEPSISISSLQDIKVRVVFCNPINQAMRPCPFYMEGNCRFADEDCRYSHGHIVRLEDLTEFLNHDYSNLQRDSRCLARYVDSLWYPAVIEEVKDDHKFVVQYSQYRSTAELDLEEIIPVDVGDSDSSSSESDCEQQSRAEPDIDEESLQSAIIEMKYPHLALGDWEKHTRGIGSKLMEKMGYVSGTGLGKNGEGRMEPVEAVIVPKGKSLDKCMELKEKKLLGLGQCDGPRQDRRKRNVVRRERQKERRHLANIASGYNNCKTKEEKSVFDFLNNRLAVGRHETMFLNSDTHAAAAKQQSEMRATSTKTLNVQSLRLSEDIKKAELELCKLQAALLRNQDKDRTVASSLRGRIASAEISLKQLHNSVTAIASEQNSRRSQQKLSVF